MENTFVKTKKSRVALTSSSKETKEMISEEEIRNRAYEIYQEDINSSFNELDNWYYAERELKGYYKQVNLKMHQVYHIFVLYGQGILIYPV